MTNTGKQPEKVNYTSILTNLISKMSENQKKALLLMAEEILSLDQRSHPRKSYTITANYAIEDQMFQDLIKDISAGGIFIETQQPLSLGQKIILTFPVPSQENHLKITGEVVRTTEDGFGVKFRKVE